jgi:hypothetical protein
MDRQAIPEIKQFGPLSYRITFDREIQVIEMMNLMRTEHGVMVCPYHKAQDFDPFHLPRAPKDYYRVHFNLRSRHSVDIVFQIEEDDFD